MRYRKSPKLPLDLIILCLLPSSYVRDEVGIIKTFTLSVGVAVATWRGRERERERERESERYM